MAEAIRTTVEEKEKQKYLVQQQLLIKLEALPDKPEKSSIDMRFSELDLKQPLPWPDAEQYLERYISIIQESKISTQNLENIDKQMQTLYNRLIALDEKDPDQEIVQLQYAFQHRKFAQQTKTDKQLKEGLEIAQKLYPAVLEHIHIDHEMIDKQEKRLDKAKKNLQQLEDEKILAAAGNDVLIEQQENLLRGYLGRELADDERKEMHYQQLKLLKQQIQRLIKDNKISVFTSPDTITTVDRRLPLRMFFGHNVFSSRSAGHNCWVSEPFIIEISQNGFQRSKTTRSDSTR